MPMQTPRFTHHHSRRYASILAALGLSALSLSCLGIVLFSGLGPSSGRLGLLNFAVIDCSRFEASIHNRTHRGLPDANDFSKHKDFYAIYLWNYCSGMVEEGAYNVNFCSRSGQSLYDLFAYWEVWGASIHKEGTRFYWLENGPEQLYIGYLIAAVISTLVLLGAIPVLRTDRISKCTVALSALSFACTAATAIVAQVTYSGLVRRAEEEDMPTTAKMGGMLLYAVNWVATATALASLLFWSMLLKGNVIRRAATLDTKGRLSKGISTSADSPVIDPAFTPVRKRATFSKWHREQS